MRAAILEGPQRLLFQDTGEPRPTDREVLLAVEAVGVCGSDVPVFLGSRPVQYPLILGHEAIGRVVEPGGSGLAEGARVVVELEEHSHAAMAAGAAGLPCAILRGYLGSDLVDRNPNIKAVTCPFTGERLAAVPAHRPDVGIVHAQRADRMGNVLLAGIVGVQKEVVLASRRAIVTVEEVIEDLRAPGPNAVVLPSWAVSAVVEAPKGAHPSYADGYYGRDNAFYTAWDAIARDRETFQTWMREHVLETVPAPAL